MRGRDIWWGKRGQGRGTVHEGEGMISRIGGGVQGKSEVVEADEGTR